MREPTPKPAGTWDFYGACAPNEDARELSMQETFTLGCFQWVSMARGRGVKRGKVQYRVKGSTRSPREAYDEARAFCAKKNAQPT